NMRALWQALLGPLAFNRRSASYAEAARTRARRREASDSTVLFDQKVPSKPDFVERVHTNTVTADDIFYCFRLLLGRVPNAEEWPGHSSRAGEDLENVVSSYLTCREFAARGLLNKSYQDDVELIHLPRFSLFASKDDLAVGCHVVSGGSYEPAISAVLERYVKPSMTVIDIGAILASRPAPCFALDALLPKDRRIDLVKIDTEGAELNVLLGLWETLDRDRPLIVSEFSPGMMPGISHCTGPEYLKFLIDKGYDI